MTKNEAIRVFERAGYTFVGYNDIGWGQKFYVFENPNTEEFTGNAYSTFTLSRLRSKARHLDHNMWLEQHLAKLANGIQEELFADWEIEENFAIENPIAV